MVLGVAQDAGHPHVGCLRPCCERARRDPSLGHLAACLGVVSGMGSRFLIDATPDLPAQVHALDAESSLAGIVLTHAHIGHYTGLMYLGREAWNTRRVPVYVMPRMARFLTEHGPWSQLVALGNIELVPLQAGHRERLAPDLEVEPIVVPHRDEFSETVGVLVHGPSRSVAWVPDSDGWSSWRPGVRELVERVDVAFLDGTFFDERECPGRDAAEVPHPLVSSSLGAFASWPEELRERVRFVHLNHTNPLLDPVSAASQLVAKAGHGVARRGQVIDL
ncbi:MAG: pyrroloquinoline quinone biosynthesis protein B [Kiritimatiellia bacterium]